MGIKDGEQLGLGFGVLQGVPAFVNANLFCEEGCQAHRNSDMRFCWRCKQWICNASAGNHADQCRTCDICLEELPANRGDPEIPWLFRNSNLCDECLAGLLSDLKEEGVNTS